MTYTVEYLCFERRLQKTDPSWLYYLQLQVQKFVYDESFFAEQFLQFQSLLPKPSQSEVLRRCHHRRKRYDSLRHFHQTVVGSQMTLCIRCSLTQD